MKSQKFMLGMELSLKIFLTFLILIPLLILGITLFYPFSLVQVRTPPELGPDFENKINSSENLLSPLAGTEKKIFWADSSKEKTHLSFIYLHGWSASRQEISPVVENVSAKLKANLFMTRLTGHGLGTEGPTSITTQKLLLDAEEAFQVGKKIGEKVVFVGVSTGASLAIYLASRYQYKNPQDIAALILISPNFRPHRKDSLLLRGPFGPFFSRMIIGPYYEFIPKNDEQKKYWTTRYTSRALPEMMNLVDGVRRISLSPIHIPTLFIYTESDETISVDLAKEKFQELGSEKKKIVAIKSSSHILAGKIMSPENTDQVTEEILKFLN